MYTPSVEEAIKYSKDYNYIPIKKEILSDIATPIQVLKKLMTMKKVKELQKTLTIHLT